MIDNKNKIITIDGETAAGKGTLAKRLAKNNSLYYLPAGQIFRAVGFLVLDQSLRVSEAVNQLHERSLHYEWDGFKASVFSKGRDITPHLDEDRVASMASKLAEDPEKLEVINGLIRHQGEAILHESGIVCEGRNTATALFPETNLAFYVTALPTVRARRRHEAHLAEGRTSDYETVLASMLKRDHRDKNRSSFPMETIENSIVIDTTYLSIEEALQIMQSHIDERGIV